ncbi:helix-turn-helix domain-containing protein [Halomonas sp. Bachu 37]|uniref:MerR family transcriptional regulator n=1 Tax=Halomonas kashgarensis TaxID=3084920 RepID=UPI003216C9D3
MTELLKIGEVARSSGCSVETIRHYEKLGLLTPPKRGDNGYRYYTPNAVEQLGFIRHGRELGLDLHTIHELLNLTSHPDAECRQVDAIASQHLQRIEARITALQALAQELRTVISQCRGGSIRECRIVEALFETHAPRENSA